MEKKNPNIYQRALDIVNSRINPDISQGGGSVPKPLTYDYMPEGYPTKTMGTVTLMEEQELEFHLGRDGASYIVDLSEAFEIVEGQTYMVSWDGIEYECVCSVFNSLLVLGNVSISGAGDNTGEPFAYVYDGRVPLSQFYTLDTSASHTISVTTAAEVITPMAEEFMPVLTSPNGTKYKITVDDSGTISATVVT